VRQPPAGEFSYRSDQCCSCRISDTGSTAREHQPRSGSAWRWHHNPGPLVLGKDASSLSAARAGDQPGAKPVFDLDSRKLIETAVGIRDRHELPSGRRVAGDADFFIGVADTPLDPAPSWTPVSLRNKIAAGAQFAQTQFCMDGAITRRYMNRLAEEGITERLFVLIGIALLPSARTALWMREHLPGSIIPDAVIDRLARAGDPKAEGKRICIELLQELPQIPAVSGAHIMAPRNHSAIAEVIAEARSAGRRAAHEPGRAGASRRWHGGRR